MGGNLALLYAGEQGSRILPPVKQCDPLDRVKVNPHLTLETPRHTGHVGFMRGGRYGSEQLLWR